MGARVEWVRYGREAAERLRAAVATAKAGEPLAPVTVVVPSNHVGVATRRLLASGALGPVGGHGAGLAAVTFLTAYRLAELLGSARLAGAGRRPVSTPVLAAALRRALADDPGVFGNVARHPATESALIGAYRELRDLDDETTGRLRRAGRRAGEVVRLVREARRRLEGDWYDEEDLMVAAVEAVTADPGVLDEVGAVIVHLPQRLTRHAGSLLRAVAARTEVVVLAGATGDPRADAEVAAAVGLLHPDAPAPPAPADLSAVAGTGRTRILTTSDADEEARAAVRTIVAAARDGTPLDRMALLHASPEPYARLLHDHLDAAGIPANGAAVTPVAGSVAGRALLGLLALPEGGFRRQDVFAWLHAAPVLHRGRWAPLSAWERLSRDATVVAGRDHWDRLLARLAAELGERAARDSDDPEVPAWRVERDRTDADRALALRAFVLELIDELDAAAAAPRPWPEHARWAGTVLARLLGGAGDREGWPRAEVLAAERVEAALARLAALGPVEGPVGLDVFTRTLELELESDLGRTGRLGEGVLVGSVGMGVGLDLDLVVVVGLAEGTFPAPFRDDALLPDHERRAAGGQLVLRQDRTDTQHRELLAVLAGAARQVLTVPRGDLRRSSERVPSRWVLEVASHLAGRRLWSEDLLGSTAPWLGHVASFDAGLRHLDFPATGQEHRLRTMLASGADRAAAGDPLVAAGAAVVAARRSAAFTRFDGNLAGLPVPSPVDGVTSPTRLQRWAVCPFDYLLQDVLGVEQVESPEEQLQINALDRGSLVHECLEDFVVQALARAGDEAGAWTDDDLDLLLEVAAAACDRYEERGLTGRPIFWHRDRRSILDDLARFFDEDARRLAGHGARPLAAELAFGLPGAALGPVALRLPDGRAVRFRGKVDRIDRAADGTLYVVDYKTGSARDHAGLGPDDPDRAGRFLQLPVYGEAARAFAGEPDARAVAGYWFVTAKGQFKRVEYEVTPGVLERVGATLQTIVRGIEAGVFPQHPAANSTSPRPECHSCEPDGLGVADLRRAWDRKRHDPALALYADLVEPPEEDTDGG